MHNPTNTLNKYVYGANNPLKYIDRDGKDITIFYRAPESTFDTGHIFLGVVNQDTGSVAFLNFHPVNQNSGTLTGSTAGTFQNNLQALGVTGVDKSYASLTIETTPDEAQKVINTIKQITNSAAPNYSLFTRNCTTVCEDVLHELGLDMGDISPSQYWHDLFIKYSPDMDTNPFKAFNVPHEYGHDYGMPRYNLNYTQILFYFMNSLNDDSSVTTSETDFLPDGTTRLQ